MRYDFDQVIDRRGTDSIKYNASGRGRPEDALPLWVADMDFQAPACILRALEERVAHGIFGYSELDEEYFSVIQRWFSRRFGWAVEQEWLVTTPGVVTALHIALRAFTQEGDAVLIQPPVYYPFSQAVKGTGRRLVENQLKLIDGHYEIDFQDFENKIVENQVKLFILCSPHNPVGRVWRREELERMGDLCLRHGVLVLSDEIHQDFAYPGHTHFPFASLKPEYRDRSVICTAPSKTFNIAGLQISNILIPDPQLRARFRREHSNSGLSQAGAMGIVACRAAYGEGEEWLEQLKTYLEGNLAFVREFLDRRIPQIKLIEPEGTYLLWLDFRALGLEGEALDRFVLHQAKLWLDDGPMFGPGGQGFQRVNIACPRTTLQKALERLERAIAALEA